jgi:hypothetical protein
MDCNKIAKAQLFIQGMEALCRQHNVRFEHCGFYAVIDCETNNMVCMSMSNWREESAHIDQVDWDHHNAELEQILTGLDNLDCLTDKFEKSLEEIKFTAKHVLDSMRTLEALRLFELEIGFAKRYVDTLKHIGSQVAAKELIEKIKADLK